MTKQITQPNQQPFSVQTGQKQIVKITKGQHLRIQEKIDGAVKDTTNVIATRTGKDLKLKYIDGTEITFENFYEACADNGCSVTLAGKEAGGHVITGDTATGAFTQDGSQLIYAHGDQMSLMAMAGNDSALSHALSNFGSDISNTAATASTGSFGWGSLSSIITGIVGGAVAGAGAGAALSKKGTGDTGATGDTGDTGDHLIWLQNGEVDTVVYQTINDGTDEIHNFQIDHDNIRLDGALSISTFVGDVEVVEGEGGMSFDLDAQEFGLITSTHSTISAADLSNAESVASALNSAYFFSASGGDSTQNTSIFAVTANNNSNVTAIWAHEQSSFNDSTVTSTELHLLALVHTLNGEFQWDNFEQAQNHIVGP